MHYMKNMMICPGDILVIDFGKTSVGSHAHGRHTAYVVSVDDARDSGACMLVIPIYRSQSYGRQDNPVFIRSTFCPGLRYDCYAYVADMQRIERYRVIKRVGHMRDESVMEDIRKAVIDSVGAVSQEVRQ